MSEEYVLRAIGSLRDIDQSAWNACANPGGDIPRDPFVSFEFLDALEQSQSAVPETGWAAHHLILETSAGKIVACVPLFLKSHSQGEYVFDHAWAEAFERAGGEYYPKLLGAIPFTPVTGRRILVRPGPESDSIAKQLMAAAADVAQQLGLSSLHFNFPPEAQWKQLISLGFLARTDQQFHWTNRDYQSFDEFTSEMSSKKRYNLRRERRDAVRSGIEIEWLSGPDLTEAHWDAFFEFYIDTGSRKWGRPYLTRDFFSRVGQTMADQILLVMCRRAGRYIAGGLNFIGSDCLYGRHWGCIEDHPFLHFEACYYQSIEYAITQGLRRVEAGAQGPHKLARGYLPTKTYSAHWIANPSFREAVDDYLGTERQYVDQEIELTHTHSPFKLQ